MKEFEDFTLADMVAAKRISTSNFLNFTRLWFNLIQGSSLLINWHHVLFADVADDIIHRRRENRNIVLNCPPGSTKTEFFSVHLPAHVNALINSGKLSRFRNLNLSFSNDLVIRNSVRTRDIIASAEYQKLFPCTFGVNQAQEWCIVDERGKRIGETVSRSVGGQITGSRAGYIGPEFSGLITMDDPDKISDQLSEVKRKRQHDYMTGTIRSRRGDKSRDNATPIICIAQRTHVDDTSGFLLSGGMGIKFDHVKIPALVTEDYIQSLPDKYRDLCWRDVKDSESVVIAGQRYWSFWSQNEDIKQLLDLWEADEYSFLSQYQQEPIALSGHIFNADWFEWYGSEENSAPPYWEYRFITADTATKTGTRNDFSVMCEWAVFQGNLYLLNMVRGKWEAPELLSTFSAFASECWNKNQKQELGNLRAILIEDASSGTGLIQSFGRESPVPVTPIKRQKDKLTRAMDSCPHIKAGKVYLPEGEPWIVEFVAEVSMFTADDSHRHDDQVDNLTDAIDYALIKSTSLFDLIYQ